MKVLLVYTNQERSPYPVFPLGLGYVEASLRGRGIQTRLLDLSFASDAVAETKQAVREFQPDCIGLSIRNIDNLTYDAPAYYVPGVRAIVAACRESSPAPIVAGGPGFSIFPRQLLRDLGLQAGIVGEGEEVFPIWLESLPRGAGCPAGLVTDQDAADAPVTPARVADLDTLPFPTRYPEANQRYGEAGGTLNVQTKRGCPFRCLYCNYPAIEGRVVRPRSPEYVAEELLALARRGVRRIHFVDAVFTYPTDHAAAICEEILRHKIRLHWTCGANPVSLTPELAQLMKRAGCSGVELGIDAVDDDLLHGLRKGFTMEHVVRSSEGCRRAGLPFLLHLIFGAPGDTEATIRASLRAVRTLRPTAVTYSFGLRVFPQTGLLEMLGREDPALAEDGLLEPRFYLSPQVPPQAIRLVLAHARSEPGWLAPQQRNSPIAKAVMKASARLGLPGPTWKYSRAIAPLKRAVGVVRSWREAALERTSGPTSTPA